MTTYFPIIIKIIKSKRYNICWFIRSLPNLQYKQKYQQGWCFIWYRKKEHPCWLLLVFLAVMTDLNKSMKLMLKLLMIFVIKSGHKANKEHKSDFKTSWNILNTVINKGTRTKQPKLFKEKEGINSKYIADKLCTPVLLNIASLGSIEWPSTWGAFQKHYWALTSKNS